MNSKERFPQHVKDNCPYCGKSMAVSATHIAAQDARIEALEHDDHPEWGSVGAKVETYNEFHEIALEMGYPSMTEAFEDLATLRAKVSELETQLRGATIMFADTADTIATLRAELGDLQHDVTHQMAIANHRPISDSHPLANPTRPTGD